MLDMNERSLGKFIEGRPFEEGKDVLKAYSPELRVFRIKITKNMKLCADQPYNDCIRLYVNSDGIIRNVIYKVDYVLTHLQKSVN